MATVFIPTPLRGICNGLQQVEVPGRTLRQVIEALEAFCPGIRDQLVEEGGLRPGIAIAVDDEMAAHGLIEPVQPDSTIRIVPAVGGG